MSLALVVDGSVRGSSNVAKLLMLLAGDNETAKATPGNLGGWLGKSIDQANGAKYNEIGMGQGIGSFVNDGITIVVSGGTCMSMNNVLTNPSFSTIGSLTFTTTVTPISTYLDARSFLISNKGK